MAKLDPRCRAEILREMEDHNKQIEKCLSGSAMSESKSPITCHILDSSTGKPAADVLIILQILDGSGVEGGIDIFRPLARGTTNADGRCTDLLPPAGSPEAHQEETDLVAGQTYKIIFRTNEYFQNTARDSFYPWVEISFTIESPKDHYHIPLLISPYGFTTYRGS